MVRLSHGEIQHWDLESKLADGERRLLLSKVVGDRRGMGTATVLLSVLVAVVAKSSTLQLGLLSSGPKWNELVSKGGYALRAPSVAGWGASRVQSLAEEPDEDELKRQIGRGWVRRRDADVQTSSTVGGPGMPLAASKATSPEDLKHHQFHRVMKQKSFKDFVVDARTGRPLDLTDEQKDTLKREEMIQEEQEEAAMDAIDPFGDKAIPTKYIYPDGEDIIPRPLIRFKGMMDKHVGADGRVVYKRGRVFGVFRSGAFDNGFYEDNHTKFGKYGESMGFYDEPLPVKDVDYKALRERRTEAIEKKDEGEDDEFEDVSSADTGGNSTNSTEKETIYCSGKLCTKVWGGVGLGDHVVRLEDGSVVEGHDAVGPKSHGPKHWMNQLDRHIDPRTGDEMPDCVGPQCEVGLDFDLDLSKYVPTDVLGEPQKGTGVFGQAIPPNPDQDPQERLAWLREHANDHEDDNAEGSAGTEDKQEEEAYKPPDVNPYDMDPAQRVRYEKFKNEQMSNTGFKKDWNTASWLGFIIIGPILTIGVSVFIFMTRGPVWGLAVFLSLVVLDVIMLYFG